MQRRQSLVAVTEAIPNEEVVEEVAPSEATQKKLRLPHSDPIPKPCKN